MAKYRKKPVVIEAIQFTGDNATEINFFTECKSYPTDESTSSSPKEKVLIIPTLEGDMRANVGDYIIKGVKGEFYPCKPDIFEATYEMEITEEQWDSVMKNAQLMLIEYKKIKNGMFGAINIANAITRYENW